MGMVLPRAYGGLNFPFTIYMMAICAACETVEEVAAMVRRTVLHEVGHHFGIDDRRLEELGWG